MRWWSLVVDKQRKKRLVRREPNDGLRGNRKVLDIYRHKTMYRLARREHGETSDGRVIRMM